MMKRIILSLVAVLLLGSSAYAANAYSVLGIDTPWSMEETKQEFAAAGIEPTWKEQGIKGPAFTRAGQDVLYSFIDMLAKDSFLFDKLASKDLPPLECLHYPNAIEKRDDLVFVSVCYVWDSQVMISARFDDEVTGAGTMTEYLTEEYGDPDQESSTAKLWIHKPWYVGGVYPRRYIIQQPRGNFVLYIDAFNLKEVQDRLEEDREAAAEEAERVREHERRGL